MLSSSEFYHQILGFVYCARRAALGLDAFIINEKNCSNQITFQPKNTHLSFENNKAP